MAHPNIPLFAIEQETQDPDEYLPQSTNSPMEDLVPNV